MSSGRATLPVLFCSPTMELGVDIASLNAVYMRNVPPTPANYAQRTGRAGRSGQPALVVTYCAAKSPHDQYFFARPGADGRRAGVNPPGLDLANEDLVRSHLHAVWLAETGQRLGNSIKEVLDLDRADPHPVREDLRASMDTTASRDRAARRGVAILDMLADELRPELAQWYSPGWLDTVIRGAYAAFRQRLRAVAVALRGDNPADEAGLRHSPKPRSDRTAEEGRRCTVPGGPHPAGSPASDRIIRKSTINSDFYTYRYLASEGFLPGYNFPRLPLMAFIPARREKVGRDSFLARPRFLGLAEFGPQSIIYHEGSQYRVRKAILGVREQDAGGMSSELPVMKARLCPECGYGHFGEEQDYERCVNCEARLDGGRRTASRSTEFSRCPRGGRPGSRLTRKSGSGRATRWSRRSSMPATRGTGGW